MIEDNRRAVIHEVGFAYEERRVLDRVSFSMESGEIVALIGPSGIGKTTLLKVLSGIYQKGVSGSIQMNGTVAYLSQEEMLLPWRSVLENILLPFELGDKKIDFEKQKKRAKELVDSVGLASYLANYYDAPLTALSGGMRKLISFIRLLLLDAAILLLDEPFSSLDIHLREKLFTLLQKLSKTEGKTCLFVTHDFRDACHFADRILFFSKGRVSKEWTVTPSIRASYEELGKFVENIRGAYNEAVYI